MGLYPGRLLPQQPTRLIYMEQSPGPNVTLHLLPVSSLPGGICGVYPAWWRCRWPAEQNASCASVCKTTESHNVIHKWLTLTSSAPKKASQKKKRKNIDAASVRIMVWHKGFKWCHFIKQTFYIWSSNLSHTSLISTDSIKKHLREKIYKKTCHSSWVYIKNIQLL